MSAPIGSRLEAGTATEFRAMIAEFDGKCFASTRKVTIQRDRLVTKIAINFGMLTKVVATDHRIELTCECGSMLGWTHASGDPDPFMYSYMDTSSGPHLGIIRTAADAPPCAHWHELPLRFPAPSSGRPWISPTRYTPWRTR